MNGVHIFAIKYNKIICDYRTITSVIIILHFYYIICAFFFYKLSVQYYANNKDVLGKAVLHLTAVGKLKHIALMK